MITLGMRAIKDIKRGLTFFSWKIQKLVMTKIIDKSQTENWTSNRMTHVIEGQKPYVG
jgi:hypothetical protein